MRGYWRTLVALLFTPVYVIGVYGLLAVLDLEQPTLVAATLAIALIAGLFYIATSFYGDRDAAWRRRRDARLAALAPLDYPEAHLDDD